MLKRKNLDFIHDDNPFTNLHKYTDETYGMIIYQEQMMSIVSDVASFSHEDMSRLRKIAVHFLVQLFRNDAELCAVGSALEDILV